MTEDLTPQEKSQSVQFVIGALLLALIAIFAVYRYAHDDSPSGPVDESASAACADITSGRACHNCCSAHGASGITFKRSGDHEYCQCTK